MIRAIRKLLSPTSDGQARAEALAAAHAEALCAARAKWTAARNAYRDAKSRGDKRGVGEALRAVKHAATEVVRLETAR